MSSQQDFLSDGTYSCEATLHVKDGRAYVELHDTFGLKGGATLARSREEDFFLVTEDNNNFNGHTVI
jgi:hypothetical protein